ncbi:anti-sigma factor family protein [Actinokineospora enzanensis]|uniref:anti-sigma factor family protein n=1 Tax=Actinokineospora enzanensis TaxID=155975 RepID=UPI00037C6558|nr:zf-HC2 domain-containing protein [Actinokineospora enzanensis]
MTCAHTLSLGAYLLGALDPADRYAFEAHAASCADCTRELVRLSPLPGLLHRIRAEDFEDIPEVPADLRLVEERPDPPAWYDEEAAEPEQSAQPEPAKPARRRRHVVLASAAAAVVALSVGGVLVWESLHGQAGPQPMIVNWSATDAASGVRADVDLTDRNWGTEVKIRLHDVPPGKPCKLVVQGRDGYREIAGWWATGYVQGESIPGSTSIDLSRISRVEVVTDDNIVLVDVPAPS